MQSIGIVKNQEQEHFGRWCESIAELVIDKKYQDGLRDLEGYSHLMVVFFMHHVTDCELLHVPQGKVGIVPEVGIFACRCAQRPNPIGITTVKILRVNDNVITVQGLDAIDGTPILDIKPHTPQYDCVSDAKVPEWVHRLDY